MMLYVAQFFYTAVCARYVTFCIVSWGSLPPWVWCIIWGDTFAWEYSSHSKNSTEHKIPHINDTIKQLYTCNDIRWCTHFNHMNHLTIQKVSLSISFKSQRQWNKVPETRGLGWNLRARIKWSNLMSKNATACNLHFMLYYLLLLAKAQTSCISCFWLLAFGQNLFEQTGSFLEKSQFV